MRRCHARALTRRAQHRVYYLAATDPHEVDGWLAALRAAIDSFSRVAQQERQASPPRDGQPKAQQQQPQQQPQQTGRDLLRRNRGLSDVSMHSARRDAVLRQRDVELQLEAFRASMAKRADTERELDEAQQDALESTAEQFAALRTALAQAEARITDEIRESYKARRERLALLAKHAPQIEAALGEQLSALGVVANLGNEDDYSSSREALATTMRKTQAALSIESDEGAAVHAMQAVDVAKPRITGVESVKRAAEQMSIALDD